MRKIPTIFLRDEVDRRYVTDIPNPECQWVFDGKGVAIRKYDGTCVMLDDAGDWWARREVKPGKTAPEGFQPVDYDEVTGKTMGWEPIGQSSFAKFHAEAVNNRYPIEPGTYELYGPKINGNPERETEHLLLKHSESTIVITVGRSYADLQELVGMYPWEGLVFHHPDGRMAKIKAKDFRP